MHYAQTTPVPLTEETLRARALSGLHQEPLDNGLHDPDQAKLGVPSDFDLNPELAATIREAILSYDWTGTPMEQEYTATGATAFVPVTYKDDWAMIRLIDDASGFEHRLN